MMSETTDCGSKLAEVEHQRDQLLETLSTVEHQRDRLLAENDLFKAQNENNSEENEKLRIANRRQWEALVQAEAERDRYKAALERLVVTAPREHYIGDHGMGRWETCETCENIIDLAKETLAEAVRP